jgi:ribonuclease VapC
MKTYVLDANAIILFLTQGGDYEKITVLIKKAAQGNVKLVISVVNWGEVLYSMAKVVGLTQATVDMKALNTAVQPVAEDESTAESAAIIRLHYRLGYADCFAAALAIRMNATLVTADRNFAKLGKRLKLLALPNPSR